MKCPAGRKKKRTPRGRGKSKGYARSIKKHSWKRIFNKDGKHIGRKCTRCNKIVLNARGVILSGTTI